jgi:hypothetical protein
MTALKLIGGNLMPAKKRGRSRINPELASRILRTVPVTEAFHFSTDIGQYTGEFATSLTDFFEKSKKIALKSIEFHFKRGDFERWIRETIGDENLANRIIAIDGSIKGENLRKTIQRRVKMRLNYLKSTIRTET